MGPRVGKSTFLRILSGQEIPDEGERINPDQLEVCFQSYQEFLLKGEMTVLRFSSHE